LALQVSPTCIIQSNVLTIGVLNCNRITGDLRYDNANQTPLAGVLVHLKTLLGNIVASDTTDSSGYYDMVGYSNGSYLLDAVVNYTWGGVNSTDALQVTRFFTSLVTLSPLRIKVGDVNGSGITNSGDALIINRRITGLITSFTVGNFVNNLPVVNALGNSLVANLRVLSTGDVNGTYNPQPTAPTLVLDTVISGPSSGTGIVRFTTSASGVFERGICWGLSPNPTLTENKIVVGSGGYGFTQVFTGSILGNQLYYVRAYARTSLGTYYSNEKTFNPLSGQPCSGISTVTDVDGNVYQGIQIGTQCWTQSNLKVSKYRNGDSIPTGLSNSQWSSTSSGAYAIYNNDPFNDGLYGKLYNHYAVADSRGLCPTGWHLPSDGEWNVLVKYLDPNADTTCHNCFQNIAGGMMKNTGTQLSLGGWFSPNVGATNQSGFTGLPGGGGGGNSYGGLGGLAIWWSTTYAWGNFYRCRTIFNDYAGVNRTIGVPTDGFSVRCLKNTLPQVNTTSVTNVTPSTALVTGEVIFEGDQNTTRGFCYSTTSNPTISNDSTMNGTGVGVYSDTLQNLTPLTTYYVRAYSTNSIGTSYGSELSFTTTITIGSNYAGGIVFYLDSTGQHGLVCAPNDFIGRYEYGCWGTDIIGTSVSIGAGQLNTNLILTGCSTRPIAASVCDSLALNGYSDWFLPSSDELNLMYTNLHLQNIGGFLNDWYWSSTQSPYGPHAAYHMLFTNGFGHNNHKDFNQKVRAIRSF